MNAQVPLHHEISGPSGSPPLVLSESLGSDLTIWDPQLERLNRDFKVIRYDHRGQGRSPVPDGPYRLDDLGADVIALLDHLELERVDFCGLSLGGMVGMWLAIHHPDRIDRLVLFCTSASLGAADAWHERAAIVRAQGMEAVAGAVVERWFTHPYAREHPDLIHRMEEMVLRTSPGGYASCCEAIAEMDLRGDLVRISSDTLVVGAAEDSAIPPEHSRLIAESIPASRLRVIEGAAHLSTFEQPELTTSLLLDHLL